MEDDETTEKKTNEMKDCWLDKYINSTDENILFDQKLSLEFIINDNLDVMI